MAFSKVKKSTLNEIFVKASSFCAYQERTQQEVRDKLYAMEVDKDLIEEVIVKLIEENFINEERFAKSYAGGKFRIKKWGKLRIVQMLKEKGLSTYCIKKGMEEIGEEEYMDTLRNLMEKKSREEKETNLFKRKDKISKYLIRKGYEPDRVWEMINEGIK